jgi:hypothetical protein
VEGKQPLGLGFTESRANNNGSGIVAGPGGAVPSVLVAGVIEKGSSLAEPSMDHTSLIAPWDEVVVVRGNGCMCSSISRLMTTTVPWIILSQQLALHLPLTTLSSLSTCNWRDLSK